jgi:uncharacterized glyoxalase superfamily protein PhnB
MTRKPDVIVDFVAVAPLFVVADVGATAAWYQDLLGFKSEVFPTQAPHTHAILWRDDVRILLRTTAKAGREPASGALVSVKGIVGFYDAIQERGPVQSPLTRHSDGTWQFEITDPDGYTLVFTEEPDIA